MTCVSIIAEAPDWLPSVAVSVIVEKITVVQIGSVSSIFTILAGKNNIKIKNSYCTLNSKV